MTRLHDYRRWHWLQRHTGDVDPVYPVLRHLIAALDMDQDQAASLVLLHVTYYHLGSALLAFTADEFDSPPRLPTGVERRGHRDHRALVAHWRSLREHVERHGGPARFLDAPDWDTLTARVLAVHGNGRWAAYKTAEMCQKVLNVPLVVPDAGHAHSTGPRKGLADLYPSAPRGNGPEHVAALDLLTTTLAGLLGEHDLGYVETTLCDFHSLLAGRYYLGHDIDAMAEQLRAVPGDVTRDAFDARLATLPHPYLGEVGGWTGVDRDRGRIYKNTGVIAVRGEA